MGKIKVGVILSGLGYIRRGTEIAFTEYIKGLTQKDDLEVFVFGAGKNFKTENATYIRVPCLMRHWFNHHIKIKRLHLTHNHDYECAIFSVLLIPWLMRYKLDLILFTAFPFTLLPLKIYKRFRNKNVKVVFNPGGGTAFFYSRFFFVDAVSATDPGSRDFFSKKFYSVCIPPGVDTDIFRPQEISRQELNLPEDKFIVFSSSALVPIKRIDFLIGAISQIDNGFLLVAGSGEQEDALKRKGQEILGENIKFIGAVDQPTLAKYYSSADVFCLPSKVEPFGLVLIEAMACQTPVVTNDSRVQKWIVKEGGSCVDVSDINVLVMNLEKYKDKRLAQATGRKARENAKTRFTWDIAAEKYHQLFKELGKR